MARRKKKSSKKRPVPSKKVERVIDEAMALIDDGEYEEGWLRLLALLQRYPRSKPVLYALVEVAAGRQHWLDVARFGEQLLSLERGEDKALTLNNLLFAYSRLDYPALFWDTARALATEFPEHAQDHPVTEVLSEIQSNLLQEGELLLEGRGLAPEMQLELLVGHDRVRFYTEARMPAAAIAAARQMLETVPDIIPVLNNLSMALATSGQREEAVATALRVLDQEPDNIHALSNLARISFLQGAFPEAELYAARLWELEAGAPDLVDKQVEAFSFLGQDERIRAVYARAKRDKIELSPFLLNLAAVAHYRLGDEKKAWQLWKEAVDVGPSFELAQKSLDEQGLPPGERNVPWYWPAPYWFPLSFGETFQQKMEGVERHKSLGAVKTVARGVLAEYPEMLPLAPHILERGDEGAREIIIQMAQMTEAPELLEAVYDFARGPYGSDEQRFSAVQVIQELRPEWLPEDGKLLVWVQGKQQEIMYMGFEITYEAEPPTLAEDIQQKHEESAAYLANQEGDKAEALLHQIIAAAPDFPAAHNHLALAYQIQGRTEEARALAGEVHERFPDYFFGRTTLAQFYAHEGRTEEARALVQPLSKSKKLHISEFRSLAAAQIQIALAENNREAATPWLDMWGDIEDDNPNYLFWKARISEKPDLKRALKNLRRRRPRQR